MDFVIFSITLIKKSIIEALNTGNCRVIVGQSNLNITMHLF